MNKHVLNEPGQSGRVAVDGPVWYEALRSAYSVPEFRRILAAVAGRDRVEQKMAEFAAHDAWENEGGAVAYLY